MFGGEFVSFSLSSQYKINPFELNRESPEPDELSNKILNMHSLMRVIMVISHQHKMLLDRALVMAYKQKGITQDAQRLSTNLVGRSVQSFPWI